MIRRPTKEFNEEVKMGASDGSENAVKVGFDFGANTSVIKAGFNGTELELMPDIIPTVVGYPKPGSIKGVIPTNGKNCLCGDDALKYRIHLNIRWPMEQKGIVTNIDAATDFVLFVKDIIRKHSENPIYAVVGCPANLSQERLKEMRKVLARAFDKILVIPEPFLAALGMRDESKIHEPNYIDPTRNSLIADLGAATSDFCIVQGYFPGSNELISLQIGGNTVDNALSNAIKRRYPDFNLSPVSITKLKEKYAFVGEPAEKIIAQVMVGGKVRNIDITEQIKFACESILSDIVKSIEELITRSDPDGVEDMMKNIIFTGGVSQTKNLCEVVQKKLREDGFEKAEVKKASDYKRPVAWGAYKTARGVREEQWQIPFVG